MQIDSNNLIRKLPAMIQGRCKFAKIADGGNYHIGAVDDWCLTYKEVVQAIEDYLRKRVVDDLKDKGITEYICEGDL